ncbi:hypothetical protein GCM10028818_33230 [Spirosoma horti]
MYKPNKLTPPSNEQKEAFFKWVASDYESREGLFLVLNLLGEFRDAPDSSDFISKLLADWLHDEKNDVNENRFVVRDLVRHLSFVKQLKDEFLYFEHNSDFLEKLGEKFEREVGHE